MAGAILERILAAGTVEDEHGNVLPLRDNISAHEGQRISACIGRYGVHGGVADYDRFRSLSAHDRR